MCAKVIDWASHNPEIVKVYTSGVRGAPTRLAKRLRLKLSTLSAHAMRLGLNSVIAQGRKSGGRYTPNEDAIIIAHPTASAYGLAKLIRTLEGIVRQPHSIENRRSALRMRGQISDVVIEEQGFMDVTTIAIAMGVTKVTISRLIRGGLIEAKTQNRDGSDVLNKTLIKRKALRKFLVEYPAHYDHRRCDKFWLVDMLSQRS